MEKVALHVILCADILDQIEQLGLKKVIDVDAEHINGEIVKNCGCGWKKRSIF